MRHPDQVRRRVQRIEFREELHRERLQVEERLLLPAELAAVDAHGLLVVAQVLHRRAIEGDPPGNGSVQHGHATARPRRGDARFDQSRIRRHVQAVFEIRMRERRVRHAGVRREELRRRQCPPRDAHLVQATGERLVARILPADADFRAEAARPHDGRGHLLVVHVTCHGLRRGIIHVGDMMPTSVVDARHIAVRHAT